MALLNFDSTNVPQAQAFDVIPAGWYNAMMTASEMKPTKAGDGAYLACEFTVLDGDAKGRKVFTNINIQNPNPVAVDIAYKTLSAICHSVNVIQCADSVQLHNIPLQIKVSLKPAEGQYEASNEIKGYKAIGAGAPAVAAPITPPVIPAPPAAPAWQPPAVTAPAAGAPGYAPPAAPVAPVAPVATPATAAPPPWAAAPVAAAPAAPVAPPVAAAIPVAAAVPPWAQPQA